VVGGQRPFLSLLLSFDFKQPQGNKGNGDEEEEKEF
jgi:hypothetical protein